MSKKSQSGTGFTNLKQKGQILMMDTDQLLPRPQISCRFALPYLHLDQVERLVFCILSPLPSLPFLEVY